MSIPLIGPDGRRYEIDATEVDAAIEQGFRVETSDAPRTTIEGAKEIGHDALQGTGAALEGVAEGVTGGMYGATVGAGGGFEAKELLRRREEFPVASTLGEVAGMVMSPVNKVGKIVEGAKAVTALGRIGQNIKGGAAVGTLFGAGNAISEASLGDTQLTAEKLLAGAGFGMLLGSLGGGVGGVISEGAAKVLPKLGTLLKGGQSTLDDVADHFALKAFRNTAKELRKHADDDIVSAVKATRDRGHMKLSPEAMEKSIMADVAATGPTKGAFLDRAAGGPDWKAAIKGLDDHAAALSPLERSTLNGPLKEARTTLEDLATNPKGSTWRDFDKWKQDLQGKAKWLGVSSDDSLLSQGKRRLSTFARTELDRQLVPALGAEGQAFLDTKKLYGALKTAEKMAGTGAGRGQGFNTFDAVAGLAPAVLAMNPFGLVGALGTKLIREHGAAVAAQIADKLAKSPSLVAVAESFARSLPMTAPKLGAYGPALLLAAEQSPALALAQHIVTAQADPEYAANAQMAGLAPESPDEHVASIDRATQLAAIKGAAQAQDEAVSEAVQHIVKGTKPAKTAPIFKTQDFGAKRMRQDSAESFKRRVDEIRALASDPQALIDRTSKNLGDFGNVAPSVAAQMTATADRAVKYLAAAAETPMKAGPMAREWVPTATERHAFALKLRAVQEPMSILADAARGTLVKEQIDAVRAVYPSFAADLEQKALEQLVSGEKMSYRSRLMLGMLTGVDADGTMSPQAIAANQTAIARAVGKPSEQAPPTATKGMLGQANRMALPGQRRELEGEA